MSRVKLLRAELVVIDQKIAALSATIDRLLALDAKPRTDVVADEQVLPVVLAAHRGHLLRLQASRNAVASFLNEAKARQ